MSRQILSFTQKASGTAAFKLPCGFCLLPRRVSEQSRRTASKSMLWSPAPRFFDRNMGIQGSAKHHSDGLLAPSTCCLPLCQAGSIHKCLARENARENGPPGPRKRDWFDYQHVTHRPGDSRCRIPEQLLGCIIRACSRENDVVLDPFGASGTTLAVARKLNRRFIGFGISRDDVRKIKERLSSVHPGDTLVGPEKPALSAPRTKAGRKLKRPGKVSTDTASQSPVLAKPNLGDPQPVCLRAPPGFWLTPIAEGSSSKDSAPRTRNSSRSSRASKRTG